MRPLRQSGLVVQGEQQRSLSKSPLATALAPSARLPIDYTRMHDRRHSGTSDQSRRDPSQFFTIEPHTPFSRCKSSDQTTNETKNNRVLFHNGVPQYCNLVFITIFLKASWAVDPLIALLSELRIQHNPTRRNSHPIRHEILALIRAV
jgi:hypothetical protein